MTTSVTRPCFTTPQHQTCKTKTDFFGPRPDVLRAMVSDHITRLHKGKRHYISLLLASLHQFCGFWLGCWYPRLYTLQWCGLRPSVVGQDRSQTKNIGLGLGRCGLRLAGLVLCCDDEVGSDNWNYKTCKAPVKLSPPTNQHPVFYRSVALPVAQPTVS